MSAKRQAIELPILSLAVVGGCSDDSPSTNTVDGSAPTAGTGMTQASTEGNVGDITGNKPVAGEDDSVVQGNQPMQSFDIED